MPQLDSRNIPRSVLVDGIHVPLTAPFYRDGGSYLRKLEHNVARYSLTPAAGLVALLPAFEGTALSPVEAAESLAAIGATAAPEKVLVAAVARDSVRATLELAEEAARAGFDAVLLSAPPLWQQLLPRVPAGEGDVPSDDLPAELRVYFQAVADGSPLPVFLISASEAGGYALSVHAVGELAAHRNIIGLYDADLTVTRYGELVAVTQGHERETTVTTIFAPVTRRMRAAAEAAASPAVVAGALAGAGLVSAASLSAGSGTSSAATAAPPAASSAPALKTRTRRLGFQIMAAGRASGLVNLLEAGVAGAMPSLAACAPQGCYEAYAAFKDGDPALAREKEERLLAADNLLSRQGVASLKYGCDLNGYFGGVPRLPRLAPDSATRSLVELVLAGLRN